MAEHCKSLFFFLTGDVLILIGVGLSEVVKEWRRQQNGVTHCRRRSRLIPRSSPSLALFRPLFLFPPPLLPAFASRSGDAKGATKWSQWQEQVTKIPSNPPLLSSDSARHHRKKNTLSEAVNTRPHTYTTPTVLVFHPAVQCSSRLCTSVDSSRSHNSIRLTNPQTKPPGSLFCLDETETVFLCLSAVCVRILTVVTDRLWMCVCWIERSEPWGWRAAWTVYPAVVSLFTRQMTAVQRPSAQ